jgi:hypothetical protein
LIVVDADHADAHMYYDLGDIEKHAAIPHNTVGARVGERLRDWLIKWLSG